MLQGGIRMKKCMTFVLALICMFAFAGCRKNETYTIRITIPAGSTEAFVYSEEEISATGNRIVISCGEGLGDTEVLLSPVNEAVEAGYTATYITPGMPAEFDAVPDEWFRVGVSVQNDTDTDKIVSVDITGVDVRIE